MAGDKRLASEVTAVIANLLATKAAALDGYAHDLLKSMEMELAQESTNQSGEDAHAATIVSRSCPITDQLPSAGWATALRAICDDLEDHVDIFILKASARRAARLDSIFAKMIARRNLRERFQMAKARAFELVEQWSSSIPVWDQPSDHAVTALVGRRDDLNVLVTKLIEGGPQKCVISVAGAAGSGKTTLAHHVFSHWGVQCHFGTCLAWAKAQESVPKTVLAHLLLQVMEGQDEKERVWDMDEKELADMLSLLLRGRRYLMMLDGVSDLQTWEGLSLAFPPGTQGSRVLLTTSNENVASNASGHKFTHRLQLLGEEDSWELFCRHAFPDGESSVGPREEERVKSIYALTHGLPQAVAKAGRYMLFQYSHHSARNSWSSFAGAGPRNYYLQMVVDILPYGMKLCLLYLIVFLRDRPIPTRQLIPMWAAEGFLQRHITSTQDGVESAAHQVLETLAGMNLITISRSIVGHIKTIQLPPYLHPYIVHSSIKDDFLVGHGRYTFHRRSNPAASFTRSIIAHHGNFYFYDAHKPSLLRVVRIDQDLPGFRFGVLMTDILNQKLLSYLKIRISSSITLSPIGNIPQLQILDLRNTPIYTIPPSFRELKNLWYLDLRGTCITRLPSAIEEMQQLRHLYMDMEAASDGPCPNFSSLTNLETMSVVPVGAWIENGLGMLASLKKLGLHGDYSLCQGMLSSALLSLPCLKTLRLDFGFGDTSLAMQLPLLSLYAHGRFDVPLNPHHLSKNLNKLSLRWCGLNLDPMEALGRLPVLRVLRLGPGSYLGKKLVCRRRGFKELTTLEFDLLDSLEEWIIEDESMGVLESLSIRGCRRLNQVPDGVKNISTLQTLELLRMSHKFYARSRDKGGEDWHKISHIHSTIFEQSSKTS